MKVSGFWGTVLLLVALPGYAGQSDSGQAAPAQADTAALMQKIRDLEDRMIAMEGQIRQLKAQQAPPTQPSPTAVPNAELGAQAAQSMPQTQPASPATVADEAGAQSVVLGGAGGSASKALNPDISVIGDFIGVAGHNPVQPSPSLQMHESEIGFQAIIDPYARGDFFLSFGEEGVNLEEGYITFTALPAGFRRQGRKDARRLWQSEHAAQPRAALGGPAVGHQ